MPGPTDLAPASRDRTSDAEVFPEAAHRNEVLLVGRLSVDPVSTVLPSGDSVTTFRLVVDRDTPVTARREVDTLDCAAWTAGTRRVLARCVAGDVVRVEGALRRRFFRHGAATVSRWEVVAGSVKRVARAPRAQASA